MAGPARLAAFSTKWGRCHDKVVTDGVRPAAANLEAQAALISVTTSSRPPITASSENRKTRQPCPSSQAWRCRS